MRVGTLGIPNVLDKVQLLQLVGPWGMMFHYHLYSLHLIHLCDLCHQRLQLLFEWPYNENINKHMLCMLCFDILNKQWNIYSARNWHTYIIVQANQYLDKGEVMTKSILLSNPDAWTCLPRLPAWCNTVKSI